MNKFVIEFLFSQFYTKYKLIAYFIKKITCIVSLLVVIKVAKTLALFCVLMAEMEIGVLFGQKNEDANAKMKLLISGPTNDLFVG